MKRVVITGASGLIGTDVADKLEARGDRVVRLVRHKPDKDGEARWSPDKGKIDRRALEGADVIIHLAGEGISNGLWTKEKRRRIARSRVRGTRLIAETIATMDEPPALLSASAVGFYGNRKKEALDEQSRPGKGFLAQVCRRWEAATEAANGKTRVVHMRFGVVLDPDGGALAKMLPFFEKGLGVRLGEGRHYVPWVTLADAVQAVLFLVDNPISGPVNIVSPNPVTNKELTRRLAREVKKSAWIAAPESVLRLALGGLADNVLLASQNASPKALIDAGFEFQHPELRGALRAIV